MLMLMESSQTKLKACWSTNNRSLASFCVILNGTVGPFCFVYMYSFNSRFTYWKEVWVNTLSNRVTVLNLFNLMFEKKSNCSKESTFISFPSLFNYYKREIVSKLICVQFYLTCFVLLFCFIFKRYCVLWWFAMLHFVFEGW